MLIGYARVYRLTTKRWIHSVMPCWTKGENVCLRTRPVVPASAQRPISALAEANCAGSPRRRNVASGCRSCGWGNSCGCGNRKELVLNETSRRDGGCSIWAARLLPGGVHEHRYVTPRLHLMVDDGRRHTGGELDGRMPQTLHIARTHASEPLPGAARLGDVAQAEKRTGHRVGAQRIKVAQCPVATGQRRDDGPQDLGVRGAAVPDLHRNRLVKEFKEPEAPRGSSQNRCAAEGGQVQVSEFELDLGRANFSLFQASPDK